MIGKPSPDAKLVARFAEPPWNEQSAPWCQIDAQLSPDHLAREIRQAMTHLDLTSLYNSYAGRGKVPYRPDLMLAIVLFELRRGQRQPSQWFQDTHENCALWWLGYGIRPSRSCWYEFRDRTGPSLDRLNMHVLHQAVDVELTQVERGALDASAVAVNAAHAFGTCETEAGPSVACVWDLSAQTGPVALPTLGGLEAHAEAMNAKGMGVGWSQRAAGGEHATLWPLGAGLPIDLTPQSDNFTIAYAINARNTVVGSGGNGQAFRWTPEAGLQLIAPLPGDIASRLTAVNDAGLAVGTSVGSGPPPGPLPSRAVRLVARHLEDLNPLAAVQDGCKLESAVGVSPRGVIGVAGHCQGDAFPHAWLLVPRQGRHE